MSMKHLESQRGQTLPFWVVGVLIVLSLAFVLANYANAVAWQIRAQNAADAAASGVLSVQANMYNEYSTLLYATAVDEYRLRTLNQAILNTIYQVDNCTPGSSGTCAQNYNALAAEYDNAVYSFTEDIHLLDQANNMSQAGQSTDQSKALSTIGSQWCSSSTDYACQFGLTILDASSTSPNGNGNNGGFIASGDNQVDLIMCKNVGYFASGLFPGLNNATFKIIGRAAAAVVPVNQESFKPSSINPQTGQPYQPTEYQWAPGDSDTAYQVNFSGLTVNLNWYQAGAVRPYVSTVGTINCK